MATLEELAAELGAELRGPPDREVTAVASLARAGPRDLAYLASSTLRDRLAQCSAAAVLCRADDAGHCPVAVLVVDDPHAAFARVSHRFDPAPADPVGVHPSAVVDASAKVSESASVGAAVVVGAGAEIGEDAVIMAGSHLGAGSVLGAGSKVWPNVTIYHGVSVGPRTMIHAGSVLGSDGFGLAPTSSGWIKVAQVGGLRIGADVEIGAGCTIDRGALDDTLIGDGVKMDDQVHVAHNVVIGEHTAIAAKVGIAGSARIGRRCMFAGMAGVNAHVEICDDVQVLGMTMITRSIRRPGVYGSGLPAEEQRTWQRNVARFRRLDQLVRRVARLEKG